ncbi:MAG: long-chain fatty acid--CoA ligase, partial [Deltaproteobacteria bacterium]
MPRPIPRPEPVTTATFPSSMPMRADLRGGLIRVGLTRPRSKCQSSSVLLERLPMALLLGEIVRRHACHRPERTAYVIGPHRVTYRQLNALTNRLAHVLRGHGVARGDRVATLALNRLEYPAIYFALAKLG